MSSLTLLAAAAPTRLDPIRLFLDADIVVQLVMTGLLLASIWVWMIIVSFSLRVAKLRTKTIEYESEFWQADSFDSFASERGKKDLPVARVAQAAVSEYRRSTKTAVRDPEALRGRITTAMDSQIAHETDEIAERLNFLATVGSVAPFVGLFGTVWGIMNSFFQIGAQESSSLAVVAPGISEALFATAIGLFAAIPAVIAYNRFSHRVDRYEARLQRFADKLNATFSRQLEAR
ncbi:protein TolQ [Qipengyuania citrea]|jgi:biopolymer transport protein TolQ|uniref:Protein TolQ n=1 Tax=Qipengyuania citrea TaxID=225971 RepID=A0ABY4U4E6_9SPHN|nr:MULTISPECIES: protein TolQ [Erythrobacteraceae]MAB46649.1 protein TolQ [Sphingomonadaceae bacterium]MAG40779.1 protein TolQ [Erythrobacteraceae bacterium]MBL4895969.1 protein TolQ [Erythrobacter sp.]MEC7889367.1 protein TolQ [Pseudomonadota bacterium]QPL40953.1 protein TolQ [Erythrobacter sp. A30-3]|tara:strand:+ start:1669 stop:2367 length:699 start_codon:yes stop_codon:yes gene_type:complete